MLTARLPTGTSFTNFSSNIRLSFAISLSSCLTLAPSVTVAVAGLARTPAEPREPTLGLCTGANYDDRNVIGAAAFVGHRHQVFGSCLGIGLGLQGAGSFGFHYHAGQAVGAEQQHVAGKQRLLFGVHFDVWIGTQGAQQHALQFALFGLRGGANAAAYLFGDERVIAGELLQGTGAQNVGSAVAHVREAQAILRDPYSGEGGAHAALFGMPRGGFKDFFIGQMHGAREALGTRGPARLGLAKNRQSGIVFAFQAMLDDGFHRQGAGHFAVGFAAHAVGQHEQPQLGDDAIAVFVVGAHATDISHAATCNSHTNSWMVGGHPCPRGTASIYASRAGAAPKDGEPYVIRAF